MISRLSWLRPALLVMLAALLAGCAAAPAPPAGPAAAPQQPAQPGPQRWLGSDAAELLAAVPQLPAALPAAPAATADPALLERWREPAARWTELERQASAAEQLDAPRASRALALLGAAIGEGLAVAALARAGGMEISDDAVVAEAASRVIAHNHPLMSLASQELEPATWAGFWRDEASAAGVANGRHMGAAVAAATLAWAAADGAAQPSAPGYKAALEPE